MVQIRGEANEQIQVTCTYVFYGLLLSHLYGRG